MKVSERIMARRSEWQELESLISHVGERMRPADPEKVLRLAALYRATCADLALAQAYHLPTETERYLQQLVARAHSVVYQSERFDIRRWGRILFVDVPRRLRADGCVHLAFAFFWFAFLGSLYLAYVREGFADTTVGEATLSQVEMMYSSAKEGRPADSSAAMAGFYVSNNAGIGLRCFAGGILLGIGSLAVLTFNGIFLGTIFGHMLTTPQATNFMEFVTAHSPFELTAICLSGGAGLRLGFSLVSTAGQSRWASLESAAPRALELAVTAAILFMLAAFIEGFISPSALPYAAKLATCIVTTALLLAYVFGLGWDRRAA